jgi:hypothetical protein
MLSSEDESEGNCWRTWEVMVWAAFMEESSFDTGETGAVTKGDAWRHRWQGDELK